MGREPCVKPVSLLPVSLAPDPALVATRRLLASARGLALTARRLAASGGVGQHPGRRADRSRELWQHRAYQPGDEPDRIDWKLLARSDRMFVRQGAGEVPVPVAVVLDASGSMAHPWSGREGRCKLEVASVLAAALSWLAAAQGDPFSLHVVADGRVAPLSIPGRRRSLASLVRSLVAVAPAGRWPAESAALTSSLQQAQPRGRPVGPLTRLTVVITDGHEHDGEIRAALAPLRSPGHELLLWHLIARDEREFPHEGPVWLEEWETGRVREAEAEVVRAAFHAAAESARQAWRRSWPSEALDYLALDETSSLERTLGGYLRRRRGA